MINVLIVVLNLKNIANIVHNTNVKNVLLMATEILKQDRVLVHVEKENMRIIYTKFVIIA